MKTPGKCIFCGGGNLSKQHVIPDWIKGIIPRNATESTKHQNFKPRFQYVDDMLVVKPELEVHNGHIGTRKIRNVCTRCNNGWMSKLEGEAKPLLTSLMLGQNVELDDNAQKTLSRWIVMTSIMVEFTDLQSIAIPPEDRVTLMKGQVPSEKWKIRIGRCQENQWLGMGYRHHCATCLRRSSPLLIGEEMDTPRNMQSSTFVIGRLLIFATSTPLPESEINFVPSIEKKLILISPSIDQKAIKKSQTESVSDSELEQIANALFSLGMGSRHHQSWPGVVASLVTDHLRKKTTLEC